MTSKRLKRILRVRKLIETTRAADLAQSRSDLDAARRELDDAGKRLDAHDEAVGKMNLDPALEDSATLYRKRLAEGRRESASEVDTQVDLVEEHRAEVESAYRGRRLMENLHDRVRARELQNAFSEEAKAHDALALAAYVRNGGTDR